MKLERNQYLAAQKPVLRRLLERLQEEYSYASILAIDSKTKNYRISKSGTNISSEGFLSGRGFVIKVYDGKGYAEYSVSEISEKDIEGITAQIKSRLMPLANQLPEGVTESNYEKLADDACIFAESTEYEIHPDTMGDEAIIEYLSKTRQKALSFDERILDCSVGCSYQEVSKLFLSKNKDMEQNILWMTGSLYAMASKGEEIKDYYKGYSNSGGAEVLQAMENDAENVARLTLELLESEPMIPGEYDCICTPEVTGMIVHEAFGHGVEMDMFVKKRALAEQYIGKYVASELVTMLDGAQAAKETATYFFDDEGTLGSDTVIIEKGILKRGICDAQSAMHLKTQPTGNGRRQHFDHKAYTRMTNTFFEAGTDKLEDMIASISYGFLIENATSGMEDPKNWGIQCMVNIAREIKDGKLTGKIYSPIVLTGYVPDLLKSITMMSDKVELGGGGYCGKGYKEWVKVSDGGPYIKARIRLG